MLAVFSHKAQIATDLREMKVGPAAVCHTRWSSVSCERPEVYPQCAWANQKKSCCALNSAQETDTPAFCNFQEYETSRAFSIIVNCSQRHKIEVMHGMNANRWGALWQHCFWIYGCLYVLIYVSFLIWWGKHCLAKTMSSTVWLACSHVIPMSLNHKLSSNNW